MWIENCTVSVHAERYALEFLANGIFSMSHENEKSMTGVSSVQYLYRNYVIVILQADVLIIKLNLATTYQNYFYIRKHINTFTLGSV